MEGNNPRFQTEMFYLISFLAFQGYIITAVAGVSDAKHEMLCLWK